MSATYKQPITANGDYLLCSTSDGNQFVGFQAFLSIVMTGTATWALFVSPDEGTTLLPAKAGGVAITGTASDTVPLQLPTGRYGSRLRLYLRISGAAGLSMQTFMQVS